MFWMAKKWKRLDMQFSTARLNKDSRLHIHTQGDIVVHASPCMCARLLSPWSIHCRRVGPSYTAYWPPTLSAGPLIVEGKRCKGEKNRRRDKVVKKRAKTTGRHPDSWGLRWSLCLAFRCLSRLRFGGGVVTKEADKEKLVHRDQESEGGREGKNEKML